MLRRVRAILSWLLLFVLPIHGMASGIVLPCASMAMPALSASGSVMSTETAHTIDSTQAAAHGVESSPYGGDEHMGSHSSDRGGMNCASSGACGVVGAQAPATLLPLLHPTVRTIPVSAETHLHPLFFTGAPERPPRVRA